MASTLLKNLIATPCSESELLACAGDRETGVLAKLSRHQLQALCNEGGMVPKGYSVENTGLPTEDVLKIARFTVALEYYRNSIEYVKAEYNNRKLKYEKFILSILQVHATRQTTALNKNQAAKAQRSANTMAEATETTTGTKHAGKSATKKGAAKKAPAKSAAKKAPKKAAEGEEATSRYANDTRKIKVLNKENPHREGTGRYLAFEAVKGSKTVADYAATGNKPKYIAAWEASGHIDVA